MNYLRLLMIPMLLGLLAAALTGCPKPEGDPTTVAVTDDGSQPPSTTIVDNTSPPPAGDTNVDVNVTTDSSAPDETVVVTEETRTKYPEVVTVVEKQVVTPDDTTIYVKDAPAVKVWTTKIVPANPPADVVYRVRDLNVINATDTQLTAEGYVLVKSPAPDFPSERKYVTYTFQKDPATNQWLVYDLAVTRTEPATPEDLGTAAAGSADAGAAGGAGNTSGGTSGSTGGGY
jgi:hypothetical protein